MAATTARLTASGSSAWPAALRPIRPLPRRAAWAAMAVARSAGQDGDSLAMALAKAAVVGRGGCRRGARPPDRRTAPRQFQRHLRWRRDRAERRPRGAGVAEDAKGLRPVNLIDGSPVPLRLPSINFRRGRQRTARPFANKVVVAD